MSKSKQFAGQPLLNQMLKFSDKGNQVSLMFSIDRQQVYLKSKGFFQKRTATGILLICATVTALIAASAPLYSFYQKVTALRLTPILPQALSWWWAVLSPGIHAIIAGVILAFIIPYTGSGNWTGSRISTGMVSICLRKPSVIHLAT